MHVEGFDARPAGGRGAGAGAGTEAFGEERARVGDVGHARVHRVGAGVEDEVVDGLCVWAGVGARTAWGCFGRVV